MTGKRTRNLYDKNDPKPFKVSRSGIELFKECPKCFYLDRKCGIGRPPGFPFNLNSAVDALLKKEFDYYRSKQEPHPLMVKNGIKAIPFQHQDLEIWRQNFKGIQHHHQTTNLLIHGAVDDIWVNTNGELIVVDYKATSKTDEITELNEEWHSSYKRQMEVYQWLLRKNGFKVSNTAYWVYANGDRTQDRFDGKLHFRMTVIPHNGDDGWVDNTIAELKLCLDGPNAPSSSSACKHCAYVSVAAGDE